MIGRIILADHLEDLPHSLLVSKRIFGRMSEQSLERTINNFIDNVIGESDVHIVKSTINGSVTGEACLLDKSMVISIGAYQSGNDICIWFKKRTKEYNIVDNDNPDFSHE
jgi:hypothetical protein